MKISGPIYIIPNWIKILILLSIVLSFSSVIVWCALDKENEMVVALAGILVAICSAPFFNMRTEIEKHQQIMVLEKRYRAYQDLSIALNSFIGPLRSLSLHDVFPKTIIEENIILYHKKENEFIPLYSKNSFLFSEQIIKEIQRLGAITYNISRKLNIHNCKTKEMQRLIKQAIQKEKDIRSLLRKEIGLS
ncbi:MAG: hypothetical protein J6J74_07365 [Elusimicrobiaceae bacterium]|nr:hypothetical protein [Elusimicrobiaceae bacterium]